jgi:hypothetical protein
MVDAPQLSILANYFTNPTALAGLSLLVPVILLYLLRPKPKHVIFPSTMFIFFIEKHKRFSSFLQKFIRDPLLIMQLIIITVLVSSIANPFTKALEVVRGQEAVAIVLDASASMQASDVKPNRFSKAVDAARRIIAELNPRDEVSIILAENIPVMVLNKGSRREAMDLLARLDPSDTPSNVGDAILLARDVLTGSRARKVIYVMSDFSASDGLEPALGKRIAALSGCDVEFILVGSESDNAGIVSFTAKRSVVDEDKLFATASIKNYGSGRKVKLNLLAEGKVIDSLEKQIESGGEEFYAFSPDISWGEQIIEVQVDGGDYFSVDDNAYAYVSGIKVNKILLLTGEGDTNKYLRLLLQSLRNVDVSIILPPKPIRDFSSFDVIILGDVKSEDILPGTFGDIGDAVKAGSNFIAVATENLWSITDKDLWNMMPVEIIEWGSGEAEVKVYEEHDMLKDVVFENVVAKKHFKVKTNRNDSRQILGTGGENPTPLFSYRPLGDGHVAYMGLNSNPTWSNLYYSSSFPIFWSQMIKFFGRERGVETVRDYSSGVYMPLPDVLDVKAPSGVSMRTNNVFLDKTGVYEIQYLPEKALITVSLLNDRESNITVGVIEDSVAEGEFSTEREKVEVKHEYHKILLAVMLLLLLFEMIVYRRRGLI